MTCSKLQKSVFGGILESKLQKNVKRGLFRSRSQLLLAPIVDKFWCNLHVIVVEEIAAAAFVVLISFSGMPENVCVMQSWMVVMDNGCWTSSTTC